MHPRFRASSPLALITLTTLLIVDLFFDWRSATTLSFGGALRMHAASSGWVGWGALTGATAITLLVIEAVALGAPDVEDRTALPAALVGVLILVSSIAAFADHSVTMSMGGAMDMTAGHAQSWPAYAGVALAAAIAVVALARLTIEPGVDRLPRHTPA